MKTMTSRRRHPGPRTRTHLGRTFRILAELACLIALASGCDGESPSPTTGPGDLGTAAAPGTPGFAPLATTRAGPRDGSFSLTLPADLLVQPFASTLMATSADGAYRVFVEARKTSLLEALGQLKDELIGLGFEVTEERHFETATLLSLGQGAPRNRQERSVWLVQAGPGLTLLCDGLGRAYAVARLGEAHRAMCQTLTVSAESPR